MCSKGTSRVPQGPTANGRQGVSVTDICARAVRIAGLLHPGFEWIPTVVVALPTVPLRGTRVTSTWCARGKIKRSNCILELHPSFTRSLRYSSAADPMGSTVASDLRSDVSQ